MKSRVYSGLSALLDCLCLHYLTSCWLDRNRLLCLYHLDIDLLGLGGDDLLHWLDDGLDYLRLSWLLRSNLLYNLRNLRC